VVVEDFYRNKKAVKSNETSATQPVLAGENII
jgi:hypothetical protein